MNKSKPAKTPSIQASPDLTPAPVVEEKILTLLPDPPKPVISVLTGRTLYPNTHKTGFAILPSVSKTGLVAAEKSWQNWVEETVVKRMLKIGIAQTARTWRNTGLPAGNKGIIDACFAARTSAEFRAALERLIKHLSDMEASAAASISSPDGTVKKGRLSGQALRIVESLAILWRHKLIAFPAGEMWSTGTLSFHSFPGTAADLTGALSSDLSVMTKAARWAGQKRPIRVAFMVVGGAEEIGDIDLNILSQIVAYAPKPPTHIVYALCDNLHQAQMRHYEKTPDKLTLVPQSYRGVVKSRESVRSDLTFSWAKSDPRVAPWAVSLSEHLNLLPNRISLRTELASYNHLLDYVLSQPNIAADPLEYCRRGYTPALSLAKYLEDHTEQNMTGVSGNLRKFSRYFEWLLDTRATSQDGILNPEYRNPLPESQLPSSNKPRGQTHRNAIPIRYIRLMQEIIEGDDFAWPKTLDSDWFTWRPGGGAPAERIWSPVRAMFYLLRLQLPVRGLQVRLLDSGEGDKKIYNPDLGGWVDNKGPHAPRSNTKRPDLGFLRRMWDGHTGRHFTGLFITTNKTQDRQALFTENGYEIPWENPDIISLFCRLRDWQEAYNPSRKGLTRAQLSDPHLCVSEDVAARLDSLFFLFRDAASPATPQEPPSDGRLIVFWHLLVDELQKRLAKEGAKNDDGSPIQLVTSRSPNGYPKSTVFDPHSLRVSGLTALAGAGVPLHILSEFVAGHATVLMTLYYQKPGAGEITKVLDEAIGQMSEQEQRNWDSHLKSRPLEMLHDLAAYNDASALKDAKETQSALWASMEDGICPNGGAKCHVGGSLLNPVKGTYGPVLGGARNCAMCRFFVTGPAFLGGLVSRFNMTAGQLRESLGRLQESETRRRTLSAARAEYTANGQVWPFAKDYTRVEEAIAKTQAHIEILSQTWMAQLRLIKRSEVILAEQRSASTACAPNSLVLNGSLGDLQVALEECSEFGLWDRICQSSDFYPGIDARLPALRRARIFDAVFAKEGLPAIYASLSDEQILSVGNAMARLLRTRLGDQAVDSLTRGETTLSRLGISLDDILPPTAQLASPVSLKSASISLPLLPSSS